MKKSGDALKKKFSQSISIYNFQRSCYQRYMSLLIKY